MLFTAFDPVYIHPLAAGHRFPMIKYELIPAQLMREGVISRDDIYQPIPVDEELILLTHTRDYWHRLRSLDLTPAEIRRTGFPLSAGLVEREIRIVRGTVQGALHALQHQVAFNVAGGTHHAGSDWGEGFCLLNDQAVAANYLLAQKLAERILIIDLDVHQGNGTAEIFSHENRVFTFSMHARNNFPFRKERSDLDIGLDDGTGDSVYLDILNSRLPALIAEFKPDFAFYLSGVDILETDKLGKLSVSPEGCAQRDRIVFEACKQYGVPVQVSMGGGYSPEIKHIVNAHCNTFRIAQDIYR